MFRVLADAERRHRLEDADGTPVGWIDGRTVGFRFLASEEQTLVATAAAWQALEAVLHREFGGRPSPALAADRLRYAREGAAEWIRDGARTIARVRRHDGEPPEPASFTIELELPSYAHEGTTIVAAQLVARALAEHVSWRRDGETGARHAARRATRASKAAPAESEPVAPA